MRACRDERTQQLILFYELYEVDGGIMVRIWVRFGVRFRVMVSVAPVL